MGFDEGASFPFVPLAQDLPLSRALRSALRLILLESLGQCPAGHRLSQRAMPGAPDLRSSCAAQNPPDVRAESISRTTPSADRYASGDDRR